MVSAINHEILYDLLGREKTRPELQKLEKTFLQDVKEYIKEKQEFLESQKSESSIFSSKESDLIVKQMEQTARVLKELYEKRETKILSLALSSSRTKTKYDTSQLLPEELSLYESIKDSLNNTRHNIIEPMLSPKSEKSQDSGGNLRQVKFLNPTPKFLGRDEAVYGPFEQDYIALLPSELAEVLIKTKRVEEI